MLRTTLAGLLAHKVRLLLSSVAIFLGVGFVAGTLVLSASMQQSFFDSFARDAKGVDAAVLSTAAADPYGGQDKASDLLPAAALSAVRTVPGVAAAEGRLAGSAPLLGSDGKVITNGGRPGTGFAVGTDPALRGFTLVSGRSPSTDGEVVVDRTTATAQHFTLGQRIGVIDQQSRTAYFTLVGTIDQGASKMFSNGSSVGFTPAEAMRITGTLGYRQINARAAAGVSQSELAARIAALPALHGDQVLTGSALATQEANQVVHFTNVLTDGLLIFAVIALFVAALVIYNTFTILVAQRMRELALLRCVGAGRAQVFGGTLLESAAVGVLASLLGIGVGVLLALGMMAVMSAFGASFPTTALVVSPSTALVSILIGTVVTVGSALLPALRATRVPPVAALGEQYEPSAEGRKAGWVRYGIIAVFGLGGLGLAVAGRQNGGANGLFLVVAGGCVLFVGLLAAGPLYVGPLTRLVGALPAAVFGTPAKLASANARRNPFRVASTTAALTIGVTLVSMFSVVSSSVSATAAATITAHYPFDFQVAPITGGRGDRGGDARGGAGQRTVPPSVVAALRAQPQLGTVAASYSTSATVDGHTLDARAMDASAYGTIFKPTLTYGSLSAVRPGTVALDSDALSRLGVRPGGTVKVATSGAGTLTETVGAVMTAGDSVPQLLLSTADFQRGYAPTGASQVVMLTASGVSASDAQAAIDQATASDPLLQVQSATEYKSSLTSGINGIMTFFSALVGLAIVIALFGIANTLSLSVIERTRESALLRAIGLERRQLRAMLALEAVQMALVGALVGIGLGSLFGWAVMGAFIKSSSAVGVITYPFARLALYFALAAAAGVLASLLPARRAARVSIVDSLAAA